MWLNAQGSPVEVKPHTFQLDIPQEAVGDEAATNSAVNLFAIIMAVIQLFTALKGGDPAAIVAALQALINAFQGQ